VNRDWAASAETMVSRKRAGSAETLVSKVLAVGTETEGRLQRDSLHHQEYYTPACLGSHAGRY